MAHRIDTGTAVAVLPATGAPGAAGFWIDGNALLGTPATNGNQDWFNMMQEELLAVLAAAGIAPVKGTYNQLLASIIALILSNGGAGALDVYAGGGPYNFVLGKGTVVLTGGGAVQVNLPAGPVPNQRHTVKDGAGSARANNIMVVPAAGTIDGQAHYLLAADYEAVTFIYNGTQWNVL